jgi:hydroxymethylglutaryl-CoA lyase
MARLRHSSLVTRHSSLVTRHLTPDTPSPVTCHLLTTYHLPPAPHYAPRMDSWEEHAIRRPHLPSRVTVYEVGPRDGLQNEPEALSVDARAQFVDRLTDAGLKAIEVGSFVSSKAIPQLADTELVYARIHRASGTRYPALVPNVRGLERAMESGVREIAVFTAASETFNRHNINAGVDESIERFRPVIARAAEEKIRVRGYVSTAFGCPYEGPISADAVREVVHKLLDLSVDASGCLRRRRGPVRLRRLPRRARAPFSRYPRHRPCERLCGSRMRRRDV